MNVAQNNYDSYQWKIKKYKFETDKPRLVLQRWSLCHWQEAGGSRDTLDTRHLSHAAQSTLVTPHLSTALA